MKNLIPIAVILSMASLALARADYKTAQSAEPTGMMIANPAAVYADRLGYDIVTENTPDGSYEAVVFPDGTKADLWDFFRGKAGQEWSYCEQHGGKIENRLEDMGSWSAEYAVCVFPDGSETEEMRYMQGQCGPGNYKKWSLDENKRVEF